LLQVFRWVTVACVLWLLPPPSVQAQYPRAQRGQFEVRGLDFRRDGAWRKRVDAIRQRRHRLLRSGSFSALNRSLTAEPGAEHVAGEVIVPVIPIAFKNVAAPYPVERYDDVFFGSAPAGGRYSLKTFYEELSNGNITVEGSVFPWIVADST